MKNLIITPTYSCPFKCKFCFNLDKCDDKTLLDLNDLEEFLKKYSKNFDKVIISGGETSLLASSYMNDLIKIVNNYSNNTELSSYPIINTKVFDDINYNISYDFKARPRVMEAWENLLKFPKRFKLTITLSPLLFKYYPNRILQTLNLLPNLTEVTFRPFYKSNSCQYDIQRKFLDQFMSMIKASNLRLNYKISFETQCDEFILTPYNKLNAVIFENDLRKEIEINPKDIEKYKTEYPEKVRL